MIQNNLVNKYLPYFLLLVVCYFGLFLQLDTLPIRIWDEARIAVNAQNMIANNNWLVTHYEGKPEVWNTKPPLLIWIQVIFMKIFGVNELAFRLPSALSALAVCGFLVAFFKKYLNDIHLGIISVLVLLTSKGYLDYHSVRTGDYESLLTMLMFGYSLSFFAYLKSFKSKYLYLFGIGVGLSVLAKSIQGLLILPGLFLFTLYDRKLLQIIQKKEFYLSALIAIAITAGFYTSREIASGGYISAVLDNEIFGHYGRTNDHHLHPFSYYMDNLKEWRYSYWILPCLFGVIVSFFHPNEKYRNFLIFTLIISISYLFIISYGNAKLRWYDCPLYPMLAIITASGIWVIFSHLKLRDSSGTNWKFGIAVLIIFLFPFKEVVQQNMTLKDKDELCDLYGTSYFLKSIIDGKRTYDDFVIYYNGYGLHHEFYTNILINEGKSIIYITKDEIPEYGKILIGQKEGHKYIQENFNATQIGYEFNAVMYELNGRKNTSELDLTN